MVVKMYVNSFHAVFMKCESTGSVLLSISEIHNRAAQDRSVLTVIPRMHHKLSP